MDLSGQFSPLSDAQGAPRVDKAQVAYDWIRDRVKSGQFGPGHRLVLAPIAEQLQMSVVPVREALRRLQAEGVVTFERNVGATVAMPDERQYVELMEALAVSEGAATGFALEHIDAATIAKARAVNESMAACLVSLDTFDPEQFTSLNREFHQLLFLPCPNTYLLTTVHQMWDRLDTLRASSFAFIPRRPTASVDEHSRLLDLIESGADASSVETASRKHRMATLEAYLQRSRPAQ